MSHIYGKRRNKFWIVFFLVFWGMGMISLVAKEDLKFYKSRHLLLSDLQAALQSKYPTLHISSFSKQGIILLQGKDKIVKQGLKYLKKIDCPIVNFWMEFKVHSKSGKLLYKNTQMLPVGKKIHFEKSDLIPIEKEPGKVVMTPMGHFFEVFVEPEKDGFLAHLYLKKVYQANNELKILRKEEKFIIRNSNPLEFYFGGEKITFVLKRI